MRKVIFDHVAISVSKIDQSIQWYTANLNADILYADDTWAMLQVGTTKLALTSKGQHPPHIAFVVENFEVIDNLKQHRDGSKYIYKSDPDGNIIELIKYKT